MTKVFTFQPEYFNNNGDQGNLEALAHFTKQPLDSVGINEAAFVLVGDASRAAMRHFLVELDEILPTLQHRLENSLPTLIIGSSFEYFSGRLSGMPKPVHGERVSEFRTAKSDGVEASGYRNSTLVSQDLFIRGAFVGTTLFGPVLAKSPQLLRRITDALGLSVSMTTQEKEWISKI